MSLLAGLGIARADNDNFADATVLSGSLPVTSPAIASPPVLKSNATATVEPGEPDHDDDSISTHSIWYRWTAPGDLVVEINTFGSTPLIPTPGVEFDTVLAVYTGGSVSSLTKIIGNDDTEDISNGREKQSRVRFVAKSGTTYKIAVDGFGGDVGNSVITIRQHTLTRPGNDDFADAEFLSGALPQVNDRSPTSTTNTNINATVQHGEPEHVLEPGFSSSVWYAWTATTSGSVAVHTTSSDFDTVLAAYRGSSVGSLTLIAENDDNDDGSLSTVQFFAQIGVTYYFAVDGFDGEEGLVNFLMEWGPTPPPNDNLANAQQLGAGPTASADGPTGGATAEGGENEHIAGQPPRSSVWYRWTSPANVSPSVEVNTFGSNFDTVLAVYAATTSQNLVKVGSNDDAGGGQSRVRFNALPSTAYRIAVDGKEGSQGAVFLDLFPGPSRPANDDFASAEPIAQSSYASASGANLGATVETAEPDHVAGIGPEASVWFKWTAAANSRVQVSTADSDFDTVLAIYSGDTFSDLVQIGSNDNAGGLQSLTTFPAAVDQTYYIAVAGKAGAEGTVELAITAVGSYALWLEDWPSLTGTDRNQSADKDGDGFDNLIEMLCGLDPTLNSHPGGADPNAANAPITLSDSFLFDNQSGISIRLTIDPNFVGPAPNGGAPVTFSGRLRSNGLAPGSVVSPVFIGGNTYEIPLTVYATTYRLLELLVTDPNG